MQNLSLPEKYKWKNTNEGEAEMFLVKLKDAKALRAILRPVLFFGVDGFVTVLPKSELLCDFCNDTLSVEKDWALVEKRGQRVYIREAVCDRCRSSYFPKLKTLDSLPEDIPTRL